MLDRRRTVLERYQIVADQDGVDPLDFSSSFLVRRGAMDVHRLYGGTLHERGRPASRWSRPARWDAAKPIASRSAIA